MKIPNLAKTNQDRAREPIILESVPGPTFHCNYRGTNVGAEQTSATGFASIVSLPRVRWLEREGARDAGGRANG